MAEKHYCCNEKQTPGGWVIEVFEEGGKNVLNKTKDIMEHVPNKVAETKPHKTLGEAQTELAGIMLKLSPPPEPIEPTTRAQVAEQAAKRAEEEKIAAAKTSQKPLAPISALPAKPDAELLN